MAITNRSEQTGGVWADGAPDVDGVVDPVTGTTYASSAMSAETMADALPYKSVVSSAHVNEVLKRVTTLMLLLETVGVLPYCATTPYEANGICIGTDGRLYQAKSSFFGHDPVADTSHTYWRFFPDKSSSADNLVGGTAGSIPYQTDTDVTAMLPIGTPGYVLLQGSEAPAWSNPADLRTNTAINGVPVGAIFHLATQTTPEGFLFCDGSAVSRTTYANLFGVCGVIYGAGDGSSTFNLPDLRGMFIRGFDGTRGVDSGRTFGSNQDDALQNLTGTTGIDDRAASVATGVFSIGAAADVGSGYTGTGAILEFDASNVARTSTETRPKNIALMPVIKY